MNKELKNLAIWGGSFLGFVAGLGAIVGLSGCTFDQAQVTAGANAACIIANAGLTTAQGNAVLLNKSAAAAKLSTAQTLLATDCPAALAAINAAYAAAGIPAPAVVPTTK